jgi:hypothetical protein
LLLLLLLVLQLPQQELCCIEIEECITNVLVLHHPHHLNITHCTTILQQGGWVVVGGRAVGGSARGL